MQYFLKKTANYLLIHTATELFKTSVEKFFYFTKTHLGQENITFPHSKFRGLSFEHRFWNSIRSNKCWPHEIRTAALKCNFVRS